MLLVDGFPGLLASGVKAQPSISPYGTEIARGDDSGVRVSRGRRSSHKMRPSATKGLCRRRATIPSSSQRAPLKQQQAQQSRSGAVMKGAVGGAVSSPPAYGSSILTTVPRVMPGLPSGTWD
jgi:hypothetical protein